MCWVLYFAVTVIWPDNAIAKHSALRDDGHDVHFQPPASDGNAYTHLYWLAAKDTDEDPSGREAIAFSLCALSDLKAKLKTEMCKSHRLGSAKIDTGYYNYWNVARFRIWGHGLKCETGLYGRSPDKSASVCNLCENGDYIQDEEHVMCIGTEHLQHQFNRCFWR